MQPITSQEASYLAQLVATDIYADVSSGEPLARIQLKQEVLRKLFLLSGKDETRVSEDIARAFQEFKRQAALYAYSKNVYLKSEEY